MRVSAYKACVAVFHVGELVVYHPQAGAGFQEWVVRLKARRMAQSELQATSPGECLCSNIVGPIPTRLAPPSHWAGASTEGQHGWGRGASAVKERGLSGRHLPSCTGRLKPCAP